MLRFLGIDPQSQNFSSKIAHAKGFGYTRIACKRKNFRVNYSLILHTAKIFYHEQYSMYDNRKASFL